MLKKCLKNLDTELSPFTKLKFISMWVTDLKGKEKPIKFQEDNIGDLGEHGFDNEFLYITPKAHSVKKKKKLISGTS